jgi:hypothetical protein
MSTRRTVACLLVPYTIAIAALSCGGDEAESSAGVDAGQDASIAIDASTPIDASSRMDASSSIDGSALDVVEVDADVPCVIDAAVPLGSPASGTIAGSDVNGYVCRNGAFAYLETPVRSTSPFIFILDTNFNADPSTVMKFQLPADAVRGEVSVLAGVEASSPGTYSTANGACGAVVVCVTLPVPPGVDCADASFNCPPGCAPFGPVSAPMCIPVAPEHCYQAQGTMDCLGGGQAPRGSWTLNLTSVGPPIDDAGGLARTDVHGTLVADVTEDGDGGTAATLTLGF